MTRLLDVDAVDAGYGASRVLFGVSLHVDDGESVALVGRNGMGKTTTIRTVMGLCRATAGRVTFANRDVTNAPPYRVARGGIGLVPEGRQIFPTLTVRENLLATAANYGALAQPWTLGDVLALFPRLAVRIDAPVGALSGGEQQMLAIGRAIMSRPRLLLIDEASLGLSPKLAQTVFQVVSQINDDGTTVVIVEQNIGVLPYADQALIMEKGTITYDGRGADLERSGDLRRTYLGDTA